MPLLPIFVFVSVAVIALFSFLAVSSWADARRKEREAFYKADMVKKVAESPETGGASALELFREQQRYAERRKREGLRIGGLINVAVGIAMMIFLRELMPGPPIYLCGLIPLFIGAALLASSFLVVAKE
ncbi:MAG: hypothetical protein JO051_08855 [Acidobacteriaceae bacterium]|nr:hypothetical protein [Acidobacteriaceae bacterium]